MKNTQKLSFKFKFLIFVMIMLCLAMLIVAYVWTLLKDYESSQPERLVEEQIETMISSANNGTLWNEYALPVVAESKYETLDARELYTSLIKSGNLSYKLKPGTFSETGMVYEIIYEDGLVVANVTLESVGEPVTKLAVFTLQEWKTTSVDIVVEAKSYLIEAPADFTVKVNGITLDNTQATRLSSGLLKHICENIIVNPKITITAPDGQEANYKLSGTRVKTIIYDYSLTIPSSLTVHLNGEVHSGEDLGDGTTRHEIRSLTEPEVKISDLMGNSVIYTGGNTLPLTYCQVIASEKYTLTVNGEVVPETMKTLSNNPDYEHISAYVSDMPKIATYNVAVLLNHANVILSTENGSAVYINVKDKVHTIVDYKTGNDVPAEISSEIDVLATAKKWSLFMSKDLTGNNYGFWDLANSLVKDSYLYNVAYKYATGIDITFTSIHSLKNPPFVNETVDNFKWITDDCFSVDIGFDKQMVLGDGRDLTDTMYSTFYFVKNEHTGNTWKLIQIKEIVE